MQQMGDLKSPALSTTNDCLSSLRIFSIGSYFLTSAGGAITILSLSSFLFFFYFYFCSFAKSLEAYVSGGFTAS
jgi:hypothetical protein